MDQRKRPGGAEGVGYYTSWEKSSDNGCIYCGGLAKTREHVPSKTFLKESYPENLPTIPACLECNNGFSNDEKYVACFLDVLKAAVYTGYTCSKDTIRRLEKDDNLRTLLNKQISTGGGKVRFQIDSERLSRILIKLAKGHAGFEMDYIGFDESKIRLSYGFVFGMSKEEILEFETVPQTNVAPEVGSRMSTTPFVVQNTVTGEVCGFMFWNDVQEEQYRYQVSYNAEGGICVKIVIYEILCCRVDFE